MNNTEQNILLIEDNPGDKRLIQEMLNDITSFKYKLTTAETLQEGCKLIEQENFILILLDLNLPDSSGKDTFNTVIGYAAQTPVVLVSGMQNIELSLSLIREGAQDFITKGDLTSNLLARTIEFAIERKKLLSQLMSKTSELEQLNSHYVNREITILELRNQISHLKKNAEEQKIG